MYLEDFRKQLPRLHEAIRQSRESTSLSHRAMQRTRSRIDSSKQAVFESKKVLYGPVLGALEPLPAADRYGADDIGIFLRHIDTDLQNGEKVVIGVIGAAGVGKSVVANELLRWLQMKRRYSATVVTGEAAINAGKRKELAIEGIGEGEEKTLINQEKAHSTYEDREYDRAGAIFQRAGERAIADHDVTILMSAASTGYDLPINGKRERFGPNRLTSALRYFAKNAKPANDYSPPPYKIYTLVVLGGMKLEVRARLGRHFDEISPIVDRRVFDDRASDKGTTDINNQTDAQLHKLRQLGLIAFNRKALYQYRSQKDHTTFTKSMHHGFPLPEPNFRYNSFWRNEVLGLGYFPLVLEQDWGIDDNSARTSVFIGLNSWQADQNFNNKIPAEFNYVQQIINTGQIASLRVTREEIEAHTFHG